MPLIRDPEVQARVFPEQAQTEREKVFEATGTSLSRLRKKVKGQALDPTDHVPPDWYFGFAPDLRKTIGRR